MDKIISIDLDICMSPYCGIYNQYVNPQEDTIYNWEKIKNQIDINYFSPNFEYINIINKIIETYYEQTNKIYIGYDHSSILNIIEKEKDNFSFSYLFDVYNIDYHHDISYSENQENLVIEQKIADCGSWVGFLNYYNCINNYYWYYGIGSEYDNEGLPAIPLTPINLKKEILNQNFPLDLKDVKILFISTSNPWIPINCYYFINNLINNLKETNKNIEFIDGEYSINRDRKNFLNRV